MKPHALDPTHAKRCESSFALESAECLLDGCAAAVEGRPAWRPTRDVDRFPATDRRATFVVVTERYLLDQDARRLQSRGGQFWL